MDITQMIGKIKENPVQFLMQRGLNLPENISNDPNSIIQHLINTGQVSQEQYNQAVQMVNQLQNR